MQTPRQTTSRPSSAQYSTRSRRLRMDGTAASISSLELYSRIGGAAAPLLLDVRAIDADGRTIVGAIRRPAEQASCWIPDLPTGRQVVAYCADGREPSQAVAAA